MYHARVNVRDRPVTTRHHQRRVGWGLFPLRAKKWKAGYACEQKNRRAARVFFCIHMSRNLGVMEAWHRESMQRINARMVGNTLVHQDPTRSPSLPALALSIPSFAIPVTQPFVYEMEQNTVVSREGAEQRDPSREQHVVGAAKPSSEAGPDASGAAEVRRCPGPVVTTTAEKERKPRPTQTPQAEIVAREIMSLEYAKAHLTHAERRARGREGSGGEVERLGESVKR